MIALGVAEDDAGGVGVGAVDDRLHARERPAVEPRTAKSGREDEREQGVAVSIARSSSA